ncbi:hypothetical protein QBC34DRAFT_132979 [Podospora aff. communis PSN243]|uniref:Extracellular membrane protein CFEM domain-containing protein n=1 Tax=Podospora aff. communis PSN243 TaxID=3040156 RepID=A0AAV9GFK1_9PEZI|nr:hypothetical protein QBC34DRAFT_132979 [Podospora aff. communis PSN243]
MAATRKLLPLRLIIKLLAAISTTATATTATPTETPMQNFPAYTTAGSIKPCATECAITPSASFKAQHSCDPVNPVSCICANGTASVELHDAMSRHCYDKCDGIIGPGLATKILQEYCGQGWEGKRPVTTGPLAEGTSTGTAGAEPTIGSGTGSAGGDTSGADSSGGLTREETIAIGTVVPIVGLIVAVVTLWVTWRYMRRRRDREGLDSGETELTDRGESGS